VNNNKYSLQEQEQEPLKKQKSQMAYESATMGQVGLESTACDYPEPVQEMFTSRVENQIRRNNLRNRNNEKMREFMLLLGEDQKLRRLFDLYDAIRSEV
jgi:hypothetical protein